MALTPEEQRELAALEAIEAEGAQAQKPAQQAGLSVDEQMELQALEKAEIEDQYSPIESGLRGAAQGMTFGFADEIEAGLESFGEVAFGDKPLSELSNLYDKNVEENRQAYSDAAAANPTVYQVGDIAGSIATTAFIPGGLAAKAAGAVGMGALSGYGRSVEEDFEDQVTDIAAGALFGLAGHGAGKGLQAVSKKAASFMRGATQKQVRRALGFLNKADYKKLTKRGFNVDQFSDDVLETTIEVLDKAGKPIKGVTGKIKNASVLKAGSKLDLLENVKQAKDVLITERSKLAGLVEGDISAKSLISRIERDPAFRNVFEGRGRKVLSDKVGKVIDEIKEELLEIDVNGMITKPRITYKELADYTAKLDKSINWGDRTKDVYNKYLQQARGILDEQLELIAKSSNDEIAQGIADSTRKIRGMIRAEDQLHSIAHNMDQGLMGTLNQALRTTGVTVGGGVLGSMIDEDAGTAGAAIGFAVRALTQGGRAPQLAARGMGMTAKSLEKLSNFLINGNSTFQRDVARTIMTGAAISTDEMAKALGWGSASLNLRENPLPRSTSEVINRREEVIAFLKHEEPGTAAILEDAIENDDTETIAKVMSAISRNPSAGKYVQKGEGWDGRAVLPDEIEATLARIDSLIVPPSVKKDLKKSFNQSMVIPPFGEIEQAVNANKQAKPEKRAPRSKASGRKLLNY